MSADFNEPFDSTKCASPSILVTGFGPFSHFDVNPSAVVVERLRNVVLGASHDGCAVRYRILQVNYADALDVCRNLQADFAVHLGVHPRRALVNLETSAFAYGYERCDVAGNTPHLKCADFGKLGPAPYMLPAKLRTALDCEKLRDAAVSPWKTAALPAPLDVQLSHNPGNYLCGFIYYNSLLYNSGRSLFVHIPQFDDNGVTVDVVTDTVTRIIGGVIKQAKTHQNAL